MAKKAPPQSPSPKPKLVKTQAPPFTDFTARQARWVLWGLLLGIGAFIFRKYLTGQNLLLFKDVGNDSMNIFFPGLEHTARYLREEGMPGWTWHTGMGNSNFPGPWFDPFKLILMALGPERLAYGIAWVEWLKVLAVGGMFYLYGQAMGWRRYVSILGAVLMAYSGYLMVGNTWYAHSEIIVSFVALLLGFEWLYQKGRWWFLPIPLVMMAGPHLYFGAVLLGVYAMARFFTSEDWTVRKGLELAGKLVAIGALALLIAAVKFVPAMQKVFASQRMGKDWKDPEVISQKADQFFSDGLQLATSAGRLFSNDMMGNALNYKGYHNYLEGPIFYIGILTTLLAVAAFPLISRRQRWWWGSILGLWVLMLIVQKLRLLFYLGQGNYYKNGLSFLVPFTLLFIALSGLNALFENKGSYRPAWILGAFVFWIALLFFPWAGAEGSFDSSMRMTAVLLLAVYAGLLFFKNQLPERAWAYSLLGIVALELCFMGNITQNERRPLSRAEHKGRIGYNDYTREALAYLRAKDPGPYRITKNYWSTLAQHKGLNDAQIQGYFSTAVYASFTKSDYLRFLRATEEFTDISERSGGRILDGLRRPFMQGFGSVKYMLVKKQPGVPEISPFFFERDTAFNDVEVYRVRPYLPLGFVYDQFVPENEFLKLPSKTAKDLTIFKAVVVADENLAAFSGLQKFDPATVPAQNPRASYIDSTASARQANFLKFNRFSQKRFDGSIAVPKKSLLFFSIPFDRGWQAKVDGQPADLVQANFAFTGLLLEPGEHQIEMWYEAPFGKMGWMLSGLGLVIFFGMVAFDQWPGRTRGERSNPVGSQAFKP